jgi:hypothetical protein
MKKSAALPILLLVVLLVIAAIAEGQQLGNCCGTAADRVLSSRSPDAEKSRLAAFQQGLQELGYLEGKNALIEQRQLGGKFDRLPGGPHCSIIVWRQYLEDTNVIDRRNL